jgi:hypothetical protein
MENRGERLALTCTANDNGHDADGHERLLNRGELDHRKAKLSG